jgi:hypothetical protein
MGLQDREYMKEGRRQNASPRAPLKSFFNIKGWYPINSKVGSMIFIALAFLVLWAAISSDTPKVSSSCRFEKLVLDSNNDGVFTYREFGSALLKVVPQTIRIASQFETLEPALGFFELNKNNCNSRSSIIASGIILSVCFLGIIYILSLIFFLFRKLVGYIIFDLIRASPHGKYKPLLSRLLYSRFLWIIQPVFIILFSTTLTIILIAKMPSTSTKQKGGNAINIIQGEILIKNIERNRDQKKLLLNLLLG